MKRRITLGIQKCMKKLEQRRKKCGWADMLALYGGNKFGKDNLH